MSENVTQFATLHRTRSESCVVELCESMGLIGEPLGYV